jgi:hypothetical protein
MSTNYCPYNCDANDLTDDLYDELAQASDDLAAAVRTVRERTEAVLAIHKRTRLVLVRDASPMCFACMEPYPCPTARAVGVTDE